MASGSLGREDGSIRSLLLACLRSFHDLLSGKGSKALEVYTSQVPFLVWNDELGRLRVWAANVGAHQKGQSSLDYRLRDSSHIRQQILNLLGELQSTLSEIEQLLSEEIEPQYAEGTGDTELQQLHATISDVIGCLYQISILIRKPARHDRLLHYNSGIGVASAPFDRGHVRNKFPAADAAIVDRLGLAITKRRLLLSYRERHYQRLAHGLDSAINDDEEQVSLAPSQTLATDFQETTFGLTDASSVTGVSETSYAQSLDGGGHITVPAPPKESEHQREFSCPYCFIVIKVKNRRDWIRHVFRDLEPYVCIFPNCLKAEELYDSRREWLAHEKADHPRLFEEAKAAGKVTCPICNCEIANGILEKHIAKHLQELALFSISTSNVQEDQSTNPPNTSAKQSQSSLGSSRDLSEEGELKDVTSRGPSRDNPRDDDRDRSRDRKRDRSADRDRGRRSPSFEPAIADKARQEPTVVAWIPSAGIDYDVISEELSLYLGSNSTVEHGKLRNDNRPGYIVRGPYTLTIAMITDLKRDTIDWEEERAQTGSRDYRRSKTHSRRQTRGVSRPLATPNSAMSDPPPRSDSIPIPGRQDRGDDTRTSYTDASPRIGRKFPPNYPPERTTSRYQAQPQGSYTEQSRSSDMYSRHETPATVAQGQGRGPPTNPSFSSTTTTQNTSQPRNPTVAVPQPSNQPTYTRQDVQRMVARKLKDEGHITITQGQLDQAIDEAMRKIQQQQLQQASAQPAPPPYSKIPTTQPSTTENRGFPAMTATAGPKPKPGYGQYRF